MTQTSQRTAAFAVLCLITGYGMFKTVFGFLFVTAYVAHGLSHWAVGGVGIFVGSIR